MTGLVPTTRGRAYKAPRTYYVILIVLACFAIGPLFVLLMNALKDSAELGRNPLWIPTEPIFANFPEAWELGNFAVTLRNSAVLASGTAIGVCVIAGLAAYALARLDMPSAGKWLLYLFVGTTVPAQLFIVPLFFLWSRVNLLDNLFGLVLIYWALYSPFATLLLRSYLLTIPREFDEAARVDGAGELALFRRIILPLARPGFLVIALVTGLWAWNEFFFAVTFIQDPDLKPIATSFLAFQSRFSRDWGLTSAAAIIMIMPVIVLFLVLQRRFIAGLTAGGIKG